MSAPKRTRKLFTALPAGGLALALGVGLAGPATADAGDAAPPPTTPSSTPADANVPAVTEAQAAFDAWAAGDAAALAHLATPPVVQLLLARDAGDAAWTGPTCDRTVDGVLCTWTSPDATLTLQARDGLPGGYVPPVTGAWFRTADGDVAQWPLTTAEEAANTQEQVDAGHSPWMLDPVAVVDAYATSQLGFTDPVVQATTPTFATYRATDTSTGVAVDVTLDQPARTGEGGIWAVVAVTTPTPVGQPTPL